MPSARLPRVLCVDDDEDGLLGSIKQVVSRAESPIPKIILLDERGASPRLSPLSQPPLEIWATKT